jgi:hypothetical protein
MAVLLADAVRVLGAAPGGFDDADFSKPKALRAALDAGTKFIPTWVKISVRIAEGDDQKHGIGMGDDAAGGHADRGVTGYHSAPDLLTRLTVVPRFVERDVGLI